MVALFLFETMNRRVCILQKIFKIANYCLNNDNSCDIVILISGNFIFFYKRREKIMEIRDIAKYIDHTLLKQNATNKDIIKLCAEAKAYGFKAEHFTYFLFATTRWKRTNATLQLPKRYTNFFLNAPEKTAECTSPLQEKVKTFRCAATISAKHLLQ